MDFDEPPFLVKIREDQEICFDESVLKQILDKLKPPFVVLSVIGSPGSGKSFFLNYFLRYLKANGERNWIGDKETPLDGFPWNQRKAEDEEGREGIRIYHEVVSVTEDEVDGNKESVRVLLLDIDYYAEHRFEENFAALEAFCLSVSNDVIYIDSNQEDEVTDQIDCFLEQLLTSLLPAASDSDMHLKYFLNSTFETKPEGQIKSILPRSLKRFKPRKLPNCGYISYLPMSFKGETKHIPASSLRTIKTILINGFPVTEILAHLLSPGKHYARREDVTLKFKTVLSQINDQMKAGLSELFTKCPDKSVGQPSDYCNTEEANPPTTFVSVSKTNDSLIKKVASEDENAVNKRYLESTGTEESPKSVYKTAVGTHKTQTALEYISGDVKPSETSSSTVSKTVLDAQAASHTKTQNPYFEAPTQNNQFRTIIESHFNTEFQKTIRANLKYFVRDDTRSRLTRIFKDHFIKVVPEYSGERDTKRMAEEIEMAGQEYIKGLKPVLSTIEKFVSMMENEFDSELYLDEDRLNVQLQNARVFAMKRYNAGENQILNWLLEPCLRACEQNYRERNGYVCQAESKLMRDAIQEVVDFFKKKLISQVSPDNPETPEKLQKQKEELTQSVTATISKVSNLNPDRARTIIHEIIASEFDKIMQLHKESWSKIEKKYVEILNGLLNSYEEQMRPYFENAKDLKIIETHHTQIRNSVLRQYREFTQAMQHSNMFKSSLNAEIERSHSERKRQMETENKRTMQKFRMEDETKKKQTVQALADTAQNEIAIGIHFGRYKIRCAALKDNKFNQVPLEKDSTVLPAYIGTDKDGRILFGDAAQRRKEYQWNQCLKISEMEIGQSYNLHPKSGEMISICFEEAVSLVLKYIHQVAGKYLKGKIKLSVITVPSLSDHTYRKGMLDATALAGIQNIHLVSECSGAISKYLQKFPKGLGSNVSVLVAYHSGKDDLEAGYFKVNASSSTQKSVSGKFYDKTVGWRYGLGWFTSFFSTSDNEVFSEIVKNTLHGANTKDLDVIISVGDGVLAKLLKVSKYKDCSTVDLATGVVDGTSYYAQSLSTKCPNLLQECLPYELQYEYLGKDYTAFNRFTPYPDEALVTLNYSDNQKDAIIKITACYSKEFSIHTQTVCVSTIRGSKFDMVQFKLKLDAQGILSIGAELVESGDRKNRRPVNVNVTFDRNMNFLQLEKCKQNLEEIIQLQK